MTSSRRSAEVGHTLRVASYNVRDLKDDVVAAARVIRAINPDVLCLQEVPRHPLSSHRVVAFAGRCGLYWSPGHHRGGGTTLMSSLRVQVGDMQHRSLAVAPLQRHRGYAVCQVRLPGHREMRCVSVHLGLDADERLRHVTNVLKSLPGAGPLLVAGDLNEGSDGRAWRALAGRLRAVSGEEPTFPARRPQHRIDVIFASADLAVVPGAAAGLNTGLDAVDLCAATDHLPVWVDLDLSGVALP